ncbi:hypothetical protein E4U14_003529, partial [Claviceps sp. LM454 group G7]
TSKVKAQKWRKRDRRACLDNAYYIAHHYAMLREMCAAKNDSAVINSTILYDPAVTTAKPQELSYSVSHNENVMLWPEEYDEAIVTAAIELVVGDHEKRVATRQLSRLSRDEEPDDYPDDHPDDCSRMDLGGDLDSSA